MLLRHSWLAPLLKPPTIAEEEEEEAENELTNDEPAGPATADKEVTAWVLDAMERRRNGTMGKKVRPALHAAPLDAVPSPSVESPVGLDGSMVASSAETRAG